MPSATQKTDYKKVTKVTDMQHRKQLLHKGYKGNRWYTTPVKQITDTLCTAYYVCSNTIAVTCHT